MQPAIKTTMNFSPAFHFKLKRTADLLGKPMSQVIEEKLAPVLDDEEKARLDRMYAGLFELEGMVKDDAPDASRTIDAYLYGWAGETDKEERAENA
jgi:hypothetical protein